MRVLLILSLLALADARRLKRPDGRKRPQMDLHTANNYVSSKALEKVVTLVPAQVGVVYHNTSDSTSEHHYLYHLQHPVPHPPRAVRLRTDINGGHLVNSVLPLRVTVLHDRGAVNWEVPYVAAGLKYPSVERTLCLFDEEDRRGEDTEEVTVIISTGSGQAIDFSVSLFEVSDFEVELNKEASVEGVTASSPQYKYVDLRSHSDNTLLELKVASEAGSPCAIVSVQPFSCPVADQEETVRNEGPFQTMLEVAAIDIDPRRFGGSFEAVLVVFVVSASDELCGLPDKNGSRSKDFRFELSDRLSKTRLELQIGISVSVLAALCLTTVFITLMYSKHSKKQMFERRAKKVLQTREMSEANLYSNVGPQSPNNNQGESLEMRELNNQQDDADGRRFPVFVNELCTQMSKERRTPSRLGTMFQKSELYVWMVLTVGIFYGIPATQLVVNHQFNLILSGDQDLCYYNFLCTVPAGYLKNFNNIYSNVYYLVFGVLFLILTAYRKHQHEKFLDSIYKDLNTSLEDHTPVAFGIPQHFGIYYAMGLALILESFFSAAYHVCPTDENFQFDTTFMYVIASLSFIKIYQFRHPDVTSSAYKVFFGIGVILFSEVVGIFFETTAFWIVSLLIYFLLTLTLTSILYHSGHWSLGWKLLKRMPTSFWSIVTGKVPLGTYLNSRMVLPAVFNLFNLFILILGAAFTPAISTYILMVFIGNLLIYSIYYLSMKFYHKERITYTVYIYLALASVSWGFALVFYNKVDYDTTVSAALSRNINHECLVLDMYDHHDIWHMFSAAGLFFVFMFFLTIDDGVYKEPRDTLHIF